MERNREGLEKRQMKTEDEPLCADCGYWRDYTVTRLKCKSREEVMNDVYCGWRPFPQFKPDDGELVICHHYWWKDRYGEPMIYRENVKMFERGNFAGMIEEKCVDYARRATI